MPTDAPALGAESEVLRVLSRYLYCVDAGDLDGLGACFSDDAEATYDGQHAGSSRPEIVRHLHNKGVGSQTSWAASCHVLANWKIDVAQNTALAGAFVEAILVDYPRGSRRLHRRGLHYQDDLVRRTEGWVIHRRRHRLLWSYPVDGATIP